MRRNKLSPERLQKDFKDPSSAQFRWQPVPGDKVATGQFYCAMVNAKKSYGAYVGFTPFAVMFASKDGTVGLALVAGGIPSPGTPQETFIYNLCKEHSLKAE
jgi:hypothetical protein